MSEMSSLKAQLMRTEILCQCPDLVNQNASDYVAGLIQQWYTINDDGEFVQTDETPLRTQDFRPMDVAEIGDYLRQTHPYLFKSGPAGSSVAETKEPPPPNKAEMDVAARCAYIRAHGEAAYQALPDNPVQALPLAERPRSSWTVEERARFIREHGQDAYLSLPA